MSTYVDLNSILKKFLGHFSSISIFAEKLLKKCFHFTENCALNVPGLKCLRTLEFRMSVASLISVDLRISPKINKRRLPNTRRLKKKISNICLDSAKNIG